MRTSKELNLHALGLHMSAPKARPLALLQKSEAYHMIALVDGR
jgi:hypothetical protein